MLIISHCCNLLLSITHHVPPLFSLSSSCLPVFKASFLNITGFRARVDWITLVLSIWKRHNPMHSLQLNSWSMLTVIKCHDNTKHGHFEPNTNHKTELSEIKSINKNHTWRVIVKWIGQHKSPFSTIRGSQAQHCRWPLTSEHVSLAIRYLCPYLVTQKPCFVFTAVESYPV